MTLKRLFLTLLLLPVLQVTLAGVWSPETLPMVHLQDARRYVCNPDGVLGETAVDSTDALLYELEQRTGVQSVVVVVEHLEGDDPYAFGMALGEKYGVGQKGRDNGLILILATLDRSYYILTGKGLEGTLPDAICRRVENRAFVPLLKAAEWDAAVVGTVRMLCDYAYGDGELLAAADLAAAKEEADEERAALFILLFSFLGVIAFAYIIWAATHKKCPHCGRKHSFVQQPSRYFRKDGRQMQEIPWRCAKCGYTEKKTQVLPSAPLVVGGGSSRGLGGGFGGGGFGGGSFGGGSFGGGGAGGRF